MLEVRLARLALPLPLELSIRRALVFPERSAQHEGLVLSWELAARILAGSMWAACREIGATSPALETAAKNLDRPSFGHWVELARAGATLLRGRTEPAAAAFATTLSGLEAQLPADGGLRQLVERIATLPAKNAPKPRRVQELLDALPFYRNTAQSTHGDVSPQFREESVTALLEALIDFCERVPLTGSLTMIFVRRLERATSGHVAEIARLSGNSVSWSTRTFDEALWKRLSPARTYLFQEPDLVVPLFPMAAVSSSGADWHVGWYARQVHAPTVAYQGVAGNEFQLALAPDELRSLISGSSAPVDDVSAAALALEPFRGLLSYDEEHAVIFHGREENTEAALARLEARGSLLIFGASGSGKSSWMKAGIVPALRVRAALAGRRVRAIVMLPGDRPLAALRRALTDARAGTPEETASWARAVDDALPDAIEKIHAKALAHLLRGLAAQGETPVLVVDQLEEVSTSTADAAHAKAFLELLATAAASATEMGVIVLASVRADLLAPLIEHEPVRAWLASDGEPIGSIPPERLTRVIVDPLHGRKVVIEPGLAETIVSDVASEPGSLALLSQVLTTLWQERERFGGALTKQGYVDAGRVSGALEKQAEAALAEVVAARSSRVENSAHVSTVTAGNIDASMSADTSANLDAGSAARRVDRLFRALAQSEENQRFARRRVEVRALASELATSEAEVRALCEPFVKRRLVVFGGSAGGERTIEVAHERLLDAWPRLRNLLASEREVLDLRREVERASEAWRASGGRSELWTDGTSKLRRAEELLASERLDLDERGRAFIAASRAIVRRRKLVERTVLAVVAVLAILATLFGWVALKSMRAAESAMSDASTSWNMVLFKSREVEAANADLAQMNQELLVRDRESRLRGMISEVAYFETLDDEVDYARRQSRPAADWWLEKAHRLVDGVKEDAKHGIAWSPGLKEVEQELARLREKALPQTPKELEDDRRAATTPSESEAAGESATQAERRTWHFAESRDEWWHGELVKLLEAMRWLPKKIEFAERSVRDPDAKQAWSEAIAAIMSSEKYRGTKWPCGSQLSPQMGLVPIGPDPESGLWEFAHLGTGRPAQRGPDKKIKPTPDMGLVFVLLPGGHVPVAEGDGADEQDKSLTEVELDPFFLSKYEMTSGQWARIGGWRRGKQDRSGTLLPATDLSWDDCAVALPRAGWLQLSSEAQWEYGCRAGTTTKWWPGNDEKDLVGVANIRVGDQQPEGLIDVGTLRANKFGLHDVHGNAWEWCRDAYSRDSAVRRAGDGLYDEASAAYRVLRGGYSLPGAGHARSSFRRGSTPGSRSDAFGLRPARGITP